MMKMGLDSLAELWNAICEDCKKTITEVGFNVWIKDLKPITIQSNVLVLGIYSDYKKQIVEMNYKEILEESCRNVSGLNISINIIVTQSDGADTPILEPSTFNLASLYTFDNFIVGSSNRFAHAACLAVSDNPSIVYNPLFIYGNSGVGKTHLMLAMKNHIEKKFPDKKVEFLRGEEFTNSLIESIHSGTINLFHQRFRTIDVLLMDDIHFIAGKESTQEEFFNTFNALYQENKQIVVTSDRPPKEIKTLDERIRSRFESGLLADVAPPDFETRVGIIYSKAKQLDVPINEDLTYYIAEQIKMNTRQLEGVVKKLQAYVNIHQKELSLSVIQGFIRDIINDSLPEPITVDKIVEEVSRTYSVSKDDIFSKRKTADIVYARQVSMYIVHEITQLSYTAIGKSFEKDHTTVLYTINKIQKLLDNDSSQKKIIDDIIKNLQG
ncbi:MAG: chromosomal replication initiator protein DnaA [Oscillospiraceae bacterium]|nr:chromosomal replication initiator protein DnaA [Oscillospiraceae bacterium]